MSLRVAKLQGQLWPYYISSFWLVRNCEEVPSAVKSTPRYHEAKHTANKTYYHNTSILPSFFPQHSLLLEKHSMANPHSPHYSLLLEKHFMANPWGFTWVQAGIAWCLAVLGLFVVPSIIKLLSGFCSDLSFDAPRKLQELESSTVPILKDMLTDAEKQRMLRSTEDEGSGSDLMMLYKITTELSFALHEAEGILDLTDYHRIALRRVNRGTRFARCKVLSRALLLRCLRWKSGGPVLPVSDAPSIFTLQCHSGWSRHLARNLSSKSNQVTSDPHVEFNCCQASSGLGGIYLVSLLFCKLSLLSKHTLDPWHAQAQGKLRMQLS